MKDKISWRRVRRAASVMSKHLAQCCNDDRQDVHDAHGQERDSDHYQPRENELIDVLGPAVLSYFSPFVFASLWHRSGLGPRGQAPCEASACATGAAIAHQLCRNSGFATLAAIRRVSSRVSSLAADRGPVVLK